MRQAANLTTVSESDFQLPGNSKETSLKKYLFVPVVSVSLWSDSQSEIVIKGQMLLL